MLFGEPDGELGIDASGGTRDFEDVTRGGEEGGVLLRLLGEGCGEMVGEGCEMVGEGCEMVGEGCEMVGEGWEMVAVLVDVSVRECVLLVLSNGALEEVLISLGGVASCGGGERVSIEGEDCDEADGVLDTEGDWLLVLSMDEEERGLSRGEGVGEASTFWMTVKISLAHASQHRRSLICVIVDSGTAT
jgi:hypothetical protein